MPARPRAVFPLVLTVLTCSIVLTATLAVIGGTPYRETITSSRIGSGLTEADSGSAPGLQAIGSPVLVGGILSAMVVDEPAKKIYVANYHASDFSVISTVSHTLENLVATGVNPNEFLADDQDHLVFVGNSYHYGPYDNCEDPCPTNGTVTMYSTATDAPVSTVVVGMEPVSMAFSPRSDELFVANEFSLNVSIVSVSQGRLVGSINLPSLALAADPSTGMVYSAGGGPNGVVSVIDSTTNAIVANISVGGFPEYLLLNSWNHDLYVGNPGSNTVDVISTLANRLIAVVTVPGQPDMMTIDSLNGDVVVTSHEFSNERQFYNGTLTAISGITNTVFRSVSVSAYHYGMVADNVTGTLYLLTSGNLTVLNATTVVPLYTDSVNATAYLLACDPAGGAIYVAAPNYYIGMSGVVNIYAAPLPIAVSPAPGILGLYPLGVPVIVGSLVTGGLLALVAGFSRRKGHRPE